MFIVLGASGHVGSVVVEAVATTGELIVAVAHSDNGAERFHHSNVETARVDVTDVQSLRAVFQKGKRAFLLNPPAPPMTNTDAQELRTAHAIAEAVNGSGLEKVVVASTYGAQAGSGIGDLSVLYEFEQLVEASGIPTAINRGAYYFSNLDMLIEPARHGTLPTMFPATMKLPMVAPNDLGKAAAERLTSTVSDIGIQHVEGPEAYSFADVAAAFAAALGHPVTVQSTPRDQWEVAFKGLGFSPEAARAYAKMTAATIDASDQPSNPRRGRTTLSEYLNAL
jgi:uncharacterized protein YbjT (DUF2867 family)